MLLLFPQTPDAEEAAVRAKVTTDITGLHFQFFGVQDFLVLPNRSFCVHGTEFCSAFRLSRGPIPEAHPRKMCEKKLFGSCAFRLTRNLIEQASIC